MRIAAVNVHVLEAPLREPFAWSFNKTSARTVPESLSVGSQVFQMKPINASCTGFTYSFWWADGADDVLAIDSATGIVTVRAPLDYEAFTDDPTHMYETLIRVRNAEGVWRVFDFDLTVTDVARRHGLKVVDVDELDTHGGSLRVYLAHEACARHPVSPAVGALLDRELQAGFGDIATYAGFAEQVKATKRNILAFLIEAKTAGKTVCGYGAPGKGNTLLNYCGIGTDFLDFTVDRNPYKQGLYTPGTHIPILPVEAIAEAKPDYIFVLPWNLRSEISAQLAYTSTWGAQLVFPIPRIDIVPAGA